MKPWIFVIIFGLLCLLTFLFIKTAQKTDRLPSLSSPCQPLPITAQLIQEITGYPAWFSIMGKFNSLDKSGLKSITFGNNNPLTLGLVKVSSINGIDQISMQPGFQFANLNSQNTRIYQCTNTCCGETSSDNGPVVYVNAVMSFSIPSITINWSSLLLAGQNNVSVLYNNTFSGTFLIKLRGACVQNPCSSVGINMGCDEVAYLDAVNVQFGSDCSRATTNGNVDQSICDLIVAGINNNPEWILDILNKNVLPIPLNSTNLQNFCMKTHSSLEKKTTLSDPICSGTSPVSCDFSSLTNNPTVADRSSNGQLIKDAVVFMWKDIIFPYLETLKLSFGTCSSSLNNIDFCGTASGSSGAVHYDVKSIQGLLCQLQISPPLQIQPWNWDFSVNDQTPQTIVMKLPISLSGTVYIDIVIGTHKSPGFYWDNTGIDFSLCIFFHLQLIKQCTGNSTSITNLSMIDISVINFSMYIRDNTLRSDVNFFSEFVNIQENIKNLIISALKSNIPPAIDSLKASFLPISLPIYQCVNIPPNLVSSPQQANVYSVLKGYSPSYTVDGTDPSFVKCMQSCTSGYSPLIPEGNLIDQCGLYCKDQVVGTIVQSEQECVNNHAKSMYPRSSFTLQTMTPFKTGSSWLSCIEKPPSDPNIKFDPNGNYYQNIYNAIPETNLQGLVNIPMTHYIQGMRTQNIDWNNPIVTPFLSADCPGECAMKGDACKSYDIGQIETNLQSPDGCWLQPTDISSPLVSDQSFTHYMPQGVSPGSYVVQFSFSISNGVYQNTTTKNTVKRWGWPQFSDQKYGAKFLSAHADGNAISNYSVNVLFNGVQMTSFHEGDSIPSNILESDLFGNWAIISLNYTGDVKSILTLEILMSNVRWIN